MKIILIGQALFGKDCLEALLNQGEEIVGVITVPDDPKGRPNPLKELALEKSISMLQPSGNIPNRLKNPVVVSMVKDLKPDLFVLAFVNDIMPYEVIKSATLGGVNYHPSLLPKYRGGSAINWAVIKGEKETGVTVHFINQRVDTGDIILQEKVTIESEDNVGSLYFNKLYPLGVKLISQAVKLIREGNAIPTAQDENQASFQPMITENDVKIDWENPPETIHDLIRGSNPSPGAHARFRGEKIKIWEAEISGIVPGRPGEVTDIIEGKSFKIASVRGSIIVKRIQLLGEKKMTAQEFIEKIGLKQGEQLN